MKSKERILAAMKCQQVDRIPFVPNLNGYAIRGFPEHYHPMKRWEIERDLGIDLLVRFRIGIREIPPTVVIPPTTGPVNLQSAQSREWNKCVPRADDIQLKIEADGDLTYVYLTTPLGDLRSAWRSVPTSDLPFPEEHFIKSVKDFDIYHYVLDHTNVEPAYEESLEALEGVGNDGTCEAMGGATPIEDLLMFIMGIETFYFCMTDHPKETEDLMSHLMEIRRQGYRILSKGPAPVVITGENTSTTTMSPNFMKQWEFPALDEFSDILHEGDKIHMVHMCGKIQGVIDLLAERHFDGIHDASPPPTGDLDFRAAREKLCRSGKSLTGGIDCNAFVDLSPEQLEQYVKTLLEDVSPGTGFLLSSGDTVPYGTTTENLRAVVRAIENYGQYPLKGNANN